MEPVNVKLNAYIESSQEVINNILNLKLVILLEHQNIKKLIEAMFQIDLNKILRLKMSKTLRRGFISLVLLTDEILSERFIKKNCKKQVKKRLQLKK